MPSIYSSSSVTWADTYLTDERTHTENSNIIENLNFKKRWSKQMATFLSAIFRKAIIFASCYKQKFFSVVYFKFADSGLAPKYNLPGTGS